MPARRLYSSQSQSQTKYGSHLTSESSVDIIWQTINGTILFAAVFADACTLGTVPYFPYCRIDLTFISQEYIHCWEESNVHLPVSNNAQLISNGYGFTEVPWYPQYEVPRVGPTSAGPTLSACISTQADVVAEQVNPFGGSILAREHQGVTPDLPFFHQPSSQPFHALPCPYFRRSPSPPTVQAVPPSPSIPSNTPTRMPTPFLSDEEARQTIHTWIMNSDWRREDKMEPLVGDPGVPTCALQLASKGQSLYCCFLIPVMARGGKISGWTPAADPTSKPDRRQRVIGKERAKRDHFPFNCPRDHDPDWFVRPMIVIDQILTSNP